MQFDLLIQNARVIDGTGQPAYAADLAIRDDRIAAILSADHFPARARKIIDARGLTIAPGFIDPHSHADLIFPLSPDQQRALLRAKISQGITTTIIGNCGLGCAPLGSNQAEPLLRAVNAWMTPEEIAWPWRTTGQYLDHLEANGVALNVATLTPHGPVRMSVLGLSQATPTKAQLRRMRALVDGALRDGALGLSTGLIYPPGMFSAPEELQELARVVAAHDGIYTSHIRGSSELLLDAVGELLNLGRATGVRVHHSHNEAVGRAHWAKAARALRMEEEAAGDGLRVSFDMFPYPAAATMMIALYPPWALEGGVDALLERLRDKPTRQRIARDIRQMRPTWPPWPMADRPCGWPHNLVKATGWDAIRIGYVASRKNKRYEDTSLAELGRLVGKTPFDAISDLLIEERGQVSMLIFEVSGAEDEEGLLRRYARHRLSAFCTDAEDYGRGLPHPAAYGALPRIFARFVRGNETLTLEEAVHKMTAYPAQIFGLTDRGVVRPGVFADLVLFDPRRIADRATFEKPRRKATGIKTVIINGRVVLQNNEYSPNLYGAVLRRAM